MKTLNEIADAAHGNAIEKGFHNLEEPIEVFMANQCNNLHGEVSELWDAWRAGEQFSDCDKTLKMKELGLRILSKTEEELADVIIRALDISRRLEIDIEQAVIAKHEYNKTRPYKHNKLN